MLEIKNLMVLLIREFLMYLKIERQFSMGNSEAFFRALGWFLSIMTQVKVDEENYSLKVHQIFIEVVHDLMFGNMVS